MTVKEQLQTRIASMSESEATDLLRFAERRSDDALLRFWDSARPDDEPWSEADEIAASEADADVAAGRVFTLETIRADLGL